MAASTSSSDFSVWDSITGFLGFSDQTTSASEKAPSSDLLSYQGRDVRVISPASPLKAGSLQIILNQDAASFAEWSPNAITETYHFMQNMINQWRAKGIENFFVYVRQEKQEPFKFEVIPFPDEGIAFFQQLSLLSAVASKDSTAAPNAEVERVAKEFADNYKRYRLTEEEVSILNTVTVEHSFQSTTELSTSGSSSQTQAKPIDVFCNAEIAEKQRVFDGIYTDVWHDYMPLTDVHLLLKPKRHLVNFWELSLSEFTESMTHMQKLTAHYKGLGYELTTVMLKNGRRAGRSVEHLHWHLMFTEKAASENSGFLNVLWKMTAGASALSPAKLKNIVDPLRVTLESVLGEQSPQ